MSLDLTETEVAFLSQILLQELGNGYDAWICGRTRCGNVVLSTVNGGIDECGVHILTGFKVFKKPSQAIHCYLCEKARVEHERVTSTTAIVPGPVA